MASKPRKKASKSSDLVTSQQVLVPNHEVGLNVQLTADSLASIHVNEHELSLTLQQRQTTKELTAAVKEHQVATADLHAAACAEIQALTDEVAERMAVLASQHYAVPLKVTHILSTRDDSNDTIEYVIRITGVNVTVGGNQTLTLPDVRRTKRYSQELLELKAVVIEKARVVGEIQKRQEEINLAIRDIPLLRKAAQAKVTRSIAQNVAPELLQELDDAVGTSSTRLLTSQ